jgi:hypothetical protein
MRITKGVVFMANTANINMMTMEEIDAEIAAYRQGKKNEMVRKAFETARIESLKNGTDKMTMEEIDFEIAKVRAKKGNLNG